MDGKHSTSPVGRQGSGDWERTTLGTVVDLQSGGTPSKRRPDYWNGAVPWVSAKDMKRFRLTDTQDHLTESGAANGTRVAPEGTVLLLTRGMTLLNHLPVCVIERPMAFNQDVKALQATEGIDGEFLPYVILGNKQRLLSLVDLAGHGTGRLNTDELRALEIVLPPLDEQRAIARVLGALDDKIEHNRRMSATLEAMARALFKSWFVDFEPVRAKMEGRSSGLPPALDALFPGSFEASELGQIPSGWGVRSLDGIADFTNGLALQRYPPDGEESLPVVKIAEMRRGYTSKTARASASIDPRYLVEDGDVLFSWSGSLELVLWSHGRGALNQHLFKVTSDQFPKWFYFGWIREHLDDFRGIAAGKATTMGHIQRHHLTDARVAVPPPGVVAAGDEILGALVEQQVRHAVEARTLASQRDALLPRLVSGEVRVGARSEDGS